MIRDEDEDDDRTIREKAKAAGVDVGNYGKHDVPVPPKSDAESDGDDIIADGVSEMSKLVPSVKFTAVKDKPPREDLMKLKQEFSREVSIEDEEPIDDMTTLDDEGDLEFSLDHEPTADDLRDVDEEEELYRRNRRKNYSDEDDYEGFGYSHDEDEESDNPFDNYDDDDLDR